MKVLFIGGTGVISSACSEYAVDRGIKLYHLNRGMSQMSDELRGVTVLRADIRNPREAHDVLNGHHFDAVVDFIAFEPRHIQNAIGLFQSRTRQYVFISSASVYQKPPQKLPITEETPAINPFWRYSQLKIASEKLLEASIGFTYTIVRPSHTYDKTKIPLIGGYTALQRIRSGLPVIVHGDGTSLWTLTHSRDFAPGLVGLLGKQEAIGEIYHITSDEWLPWNNIYYMFGKALGIEPKIVHVPTEVINRYDTEIGAGLLGDKMHSMIFDNSKIRKMVPDFDPRILFSEGVEEIVRYYSVGDHTEQESRIVHDWMDTLVGKYGEQC